MPKLPRITPHQIFIYEELMMMENERRYRIDKDNQELKKHEENDNYEDNNKEDKEDDTEIYDVKKIIEIFIVKFGDTFQASP